MVIRICAVLLCLMMLPFNAMAELTASVDRNPVLAGEFFNLTIKADKNVKGQQPDTSALLKNFVVGPTSVRSNTNIINGQMSQTTQWQIELMARNPGSYTIPSFQVGNMKSSPVTVEVVPASKQDEKNKQVYIETSMNEESLYVQQAGVYTVKLYLANDLTEGQLGTPELTDANVSQLGKQKENYEIIDGTRYLVIERNYLIQPQKSGQYTLKSPFFKGRIRDNYRTRAASAIGKDIQLTIKPIPENVSGNWLPSELVTLNEEWQPEKSEYQVGEPITRTITLTALGITKEQLPEMTLPSITGIRSFSDQADNNHLVRNGKVISQKVESFALMPQMPGTFTLPEVSVPWFNVITNRIEYAKLPERKITIVGDPNFVQPQITNTTSQQSDKPIASAPKEIVTLYEKPSYFWPAVLSGYLLWMLTFAYFLIKRPKKPSQNNVSSANNKSDLFANLKQAQQQNNARLFYQHLLAVCKTLTGTASLAALAEKVDNQQFSKEINQLQAHLYRNDKSPVDLKFILNAVSKLKSKKQDSPELNNLY